MSEDTDRLRNIQVAVTAISLVCTVLTFVSLDWYYGWPYLYPSSSTKGATSTGGNKAVDGSNTQSKSSSPIGTAPAPIPVKVPTALEVETLKNIQMRTRFSEALHPGNFTQNLSLFYSMSHSNYPPFGILNPIYIYVCKHILSSISLVELQGDFFDRQRVMVHFQQELIDNTTALVLGVGGLGQSVAMGLCRLGVKKIYVVDYDVVEASNLNRHILATVSDVGRTKVEMVEENLKRSHSIKTEIEGMHMNAVTEWGRVVEAASKSRVIFNCIDYGCVFDYAVNSLAKSLKIPYISGSSYGNSMILNYYSGEVSELCFACENEGEVMNSISQVGIDRFGRGGSWPLYSVSIPFSSLVLQNSCNKLDGRATLSTIFVIY
jgi:molybdopterin/thiamine biosynthesis adenylyltransferase